MDLLAAILLAVAPAAAAAQDVAGMYVINQMEMGGGLELRADGRFRYGLEYGAVSEEGEGDWTSAENAVWLTSNPMPKAPDFQILKDDPAPKGEIEVKLAPPGFGSMGESVDVYVKVRGHPDVYSLDLDEDGRAHFASAVPELIIPRVPVYGVLGSQIPLSADRGHHILLRFLPNDLGKARFNREKLVREGDTLVLYRYDAKIVFKPYQPRPR